MIKRKPLTKVQLQELGLHIIEENEEYYSMKATVMSSTKEILTFDIMYMKEGMMQVLNGTDPLASKPVFSDKQFNSCMNNAIGIYEKKLNDQEFMVNGDVKFMLEFSGGKYHLKYNLDPMTSLIAFEIARANIESVIERNEEDPNEKRLKGNDKLKHVHTFQVLTELSRKMANVVKGNMVNQKNANIEIVSEQKAEEKLGPLRKV